AGGVVDLPGVDVLGGDAGDVDNPPLAALHHPEGHRVAEVEHPAEVGPDDVVPLLLGHAHEQPVGDDAGVVDEDGDGPQFLLDALHASLHRGGVGDVGLHGDRPAAGGGDLADEPLGRLAVAAVDDRDVGTLGGEGAGDGPADAAAAPGDDCDLILQPH